MLTAFSNCSAALGKSLCSQASIPLWNAFFASAGMRNSAAEVTDGAFDLVTPEEAPSPFGFTRRETISPLLHSSTCTVSEVEPSIGVPRSEERRVGKEGRSRG